MRIGIDLGGSKIAAIALDAQGRQCAIRRVPTPRGDYTATLQTIADLVIALEQEVGSTATVGVATPGALSSTTGLMKNSNSVCLNRKPLDRDLAALLQRPLRLANDADCFALSEATDGAAAGAMSVFGVILGTGVGGGLVVNGALVQGPNAITGEWGHNSLPWPRADELPGPLCYCGKHGCIETFLSGPGLANAFLHTTGKALSAVDIACRAGQGDAGAEAVLQRYEEQLARALASVINIVDPTVIVLGGGLSNVQRLYTNVARLWGAYVFSDAVNTRLVQARYGDASGVRGAAWLWPN